MAESNYNLNQLTCLLGDGDFKAELASFRRAFQRIKVRLRNNLLTCKLKQLATLTRKFESDFPPQLAVNYWNKIKRSTGKRKENTFKSLYKYINQLILFLDAIIEKAFHFYSYTQRYFKLGHLIHHLIFVRVSISRLRICFKALLIYACDLIIELSKDSLVEKCDESCKRLSHDDVHAILRRNGCKPRVEQPSITDCDVESNECEEFLSNPSLTLGNEEVGELINRDSLKPEASQVERTRPKKRIKRR